MGRRLPPLPAIEAFLFAARSSSFRAAAQQLALSQARAHAARRLSLARNQKAVVPSAGRHLR